MLTENDILEILQDNFSTEGGCWAILVPEEDVLERARDGRPTRVRIDRAEKIWVTRDGRHRSIPANHEIVFVEGPSRDEVAEHLSDLAKRDPNDPYAVAWMAGNDTEEALRQAVEDIFGWWVVWFPETEGNVIARIHDD